MQMKECATWPLSLILETLWVIGITECRFPKVLEESRMMISIWVPCFFIG